MVSLCWWKFCPQQFSANICLIKLNKKLVDAAMLLDWLFWPGILVVTLLPWCLGKPGGLVVDTCWITQTSFLDLLWKLPEIIQFRWLPHCFIASLPCQKRGFFWSWKMKITRDYIDHCLIALCKAGWHNSSGLTKQAVARSGFSVAAWLPNWHGHCLKKSYIDNFFSNQVPKGIYSIYIIYTIYHIYVKAKIIDVNHKFVASIVE